ncbi:hypothetical protein [Tahibacter sp.]|uniref:hypothetical protein n=1 Tax=Tahibacter sp. TaxID=2056211 RepID=UPI0028C4EFA1|nr:hypothetical protein [Tahibacter sp.]
MPAALFALFLFWASADAPAAVLWQAPSTGAQTAANALDLRFNHEVLAQLGLRVQAARIDDDTANRTLTGPPSIDLIPIALESRGSVSAQWRGASLQAWHAGELSQTGSAGFVLVDPAGRIVLDYRSFRLRTRHGTTGLDFIAADGSAYLYADALMAVPSTDGRQVQLLAADLRLGEAAALRLGNAAWAGLTIADAQGRFAVAPVSAPAPSSCALPHWPGSDGGAYVADLQLDDISAQMMRCGEPGCSGAACTCDGPGGDDAAVVIAPRAELSNTDDDNGGLPCTPQDPCSADIPWNAKFSVPRPPYGNDQHPLLIWNLYRLDADGGIAQIGRSGVKHAFVALNTGCDCADAQILGRGCGDVYASNNNDNNVALGPRSEIVPVQTLWARCGALDDDEVVPPNPDFGGCDGVRDASGNTVWSQRLTVRESQLDPAQHAGARYLFEAWYLVRDDMNIYNSMGFIEVEPQWAGVWNLPRASGGGFRRGAALDAWTDPAANGALQQIDSVADTRGHLRLATRVHALPGGRWRYDYALMNFDFAETTLTGTAPNERLLDSSGIAAVSLALPADTRILASAVADGDTDPANDWDLQYSAPSLRWHMRTAQFLRWGSLMRYSLVADAAPVPATLHSWLGVAADRAGPAFASLAPGPRDTDRLFADFFEPLLTRDTNVQLPQRQTH